MGVNREPRTVAAVRRATNVAETNRERRYVIDPRETLRVEKEVRAGGQEILGYYHSHPNHPPEPSEFDRAHAWPWYAYVILSIVDRNPAELRGWTLDDETSVFRPEPLAIT